MVYRKKLFLPWFTFHGICLSCYVNLKIRPGHEILDMFWRNPWHPEHFISITFVVSYKWPCIISISILNKRSGLAIDRIIKTYFVKYWGYLPLSPLPLPHSPHDFSHQLMTSASSHPNSGISLELQSSPFSSRQSETVTRYQIVIMRHWDYDLNFLSKISI